MSNISVLLEAYIMYRLISYIVYENVTGTMRISITSL